MSNQGPFNEKTTVLTLNTFSQAKQLARNIFDFTKDKPFGQKSPTLSEFYQSISSDLKNTYILHEVLLSILEFQKGTTYPSEGIARDEAYSILKEALQSISANYFCLEYLIESLIPSNEIHQKLLLTLLLDLNYAIQTYCQLLSSGYFGREHLDQHFSTIDACQSLFEKYYARFKYFSIFLLTHSSLFSREFFELYQHEILNLSLYEIYVHIHCLQLKHPFSSESADDKQIRAINKLLNVERLYNLLTSPSILKIKAAYPREKEKLQHYQDSIEELRTVQNPLTNLLICLSHKAVAFTNKLPHIISKCCYFNLKEDAAKIEARTLSLMVSLTQIHLLNTYNIQALLLDPIFYKLLPNLMDTFLNLEPTNLRNTLDEQLHLIATSCLKLKGIFTESTSPVCIILTQIIDHVITHTLYAKRYLGTDSHHLFAEKSFWQSSFPTLLDFSLSDVPEIATKSANTTAHARATSFAPQLQSNASPSPQKQLSLSARYHKIIDNLLEKCATLEPENPQDKEKAKQYLKSLGDLKTNPDFIHFALNQLLNKLRQSGSKITSLELFHLSIKRVNQIYFFLYYLGAPLKVENIVHHELLRILIHDLSNAIYLFGIFYLRGCFSNNELTVFYPQNIRYKSLMEKFLITQRLFSGFLLSKTVPLSEEILADLRKKNNTLTLSIFCADVSYLRTERGINYPDSPLFNQAHALNVNGHLAQIIKRKETLPGTLPNNKIFDNLKELQKITHLNAETNDFYLKIALYRLKFEEVIIEATLRCFCNEQPPSSLSCTELLADLDVAIEKVKQFLQLPSLQKARLLESNELYADIDQTFHLATEVSKINLSADLFKFIEKLTDLCQNWGLLFGSHSAIWIALGYEITRLKINCEECANFIKRQQSSLAKTSETVSLLACELSRFSISEKIPPLELSNAAGEIIIKAKSYVPGPHSEGELIDFLKQYQLLLRNNSARATIISIIYCCLTEMINLQTFSALVQEGSYAEHQRPLSLLLERININYFTLHLLAKPWVTNNLYHQQLFFLLISDIIAAFKLHINYYKQEDDIEKKCLYITLLKYDIVLEQAFKEYLTFAEFLLKNPSLYPHFTELVKGNLREAYLDGLALYGDYIQILKSNKASLEILRKNCQLFEKIYDQFIKTTSILNSISEKLKDETNLISSLKKKYEATVPELVTKKPSKKQKKKKLLKPPSDNSLTSKEDSEGKSKPDTASSATLLPTAASLATEKVKKTSSQTAIKAGKTSKDQASPPPKAKNLPKASSHAKAQTVPQVPVTETAQPLPQAEKMERLSTEKKAKASPASKVVLNQASVSDDKSEMPIIRKTVAKPNISAKKQHAKMAPSRTKALAKTASTHVQPKSTIPVSTPKAAPLPTSKLSASKNMRLPPCPSRWNTEHPLAAQMQEISSKKSSEIDIINSFDNLKLEEERLPPPLTSYKMAVPMPVQTVMKKLIQAGARVLIFGGAIRNSLLNTPIVDYDLVTDCQRDKLFAILGEGGDNYHKQDLFELKKEGIKIDIVSTEKPIKIFLQNVDITINALIATHDGDILDPLNIIADFSLPFLKTMPGIEEDPKGFAQSILRLVRFKYSLEKNLLPETLAQMQRAAPYLTELPLGILLKNIERLFLEGMAKKNLIYLQESGLYPFLFPESQRQNIRIAPEVVAFMRQFWENLDNLNAVERKENYSVHHVMAVLLLPLVSDVQSIAQVVNCFCQINDSVYEPDKMRFKLATLSVLNDYFQQTHFMVTHPQCVFTPPPLMVLYYPVYVHPVQAYQSSAAAAAAAAASSPYAPGGEINSGSDLSNYPTCNSVSSAP